jgi:hypothetical protein
MDQHLWCRGVLHRPSPLRRERRSIDLGISREKEVSISIETAKVMMYNSKMNFMRTYLVVSR